MIPTSELPSHCHCITRRTVCLLHFLTKSRYARPGSNETEWLNYYSLPVLDPIHLETQLSQSSLSLALTPARELCTVQKAGGLALDANEMLR